MSGRGSARLWIPGILALGAVAALGDAWWHQRHPAPPARRVCITATGQGAAGLQALITDLVEDQNRWIAVPPDPDPGIRHLRLRIHREGGRMDLEGDLDGVPLRPASGLPVEALAALAPDLGLRRPDRGWLPKDPDRAWELLDLAGRTQDETSEVLVQRAEALVAAEPASPEARLALATLLTRFLVERVEDDTLEAQQACESNFQAALAEAPDLPRLEELYAIHLADLGRQREALARLQHALRRHPGALELDNGLAYAARTAGLLDLADRALQRQAQLAGRPRGQLRLADNTLLYDGRTADFEAGLARLPAGPLRAFYQGYARLLQRDPAGALARFSEARAGGLGSVLFVRLAGVYRLALDRQPEAALGALRALEAERLQMHLPDGEFTFKLAEAYGFLGRPHEALEVAERAAVQGFGCTPWFERSPFLAGARASVQWPSLDQHLRERQRLLEEAFPPSAFGL